MVEAWIRGGVGDSAEETAHNLAVSAADLGLLSAQALPELIEVVLAQVDTDGDGSADIADNCRSDPNADQADLDLDGAGDPCDPDIDGDLFSNVEEVDSGSDPRRALSTPERCDRMDNDLDGRVDEGFASVIVRFEQPMNDPALDMSVFKKGSTVPLKFKLYHCDGSLYSDAEAEAIASAGNARLYIAPGIVDPSLVVDEVVTTTQPDQGNMFRYDPAGDQFIYNWGTKTYTGGGKQYTLVAMVTDPGQNLVMRGVNVGLK